MKDKKSERVKRKRGVSDGLILPDISSILKIIGCRLLGLYSKSTVLHFISCKKIDFRS